MVLVSLMAAPLIFGRWSESMMAESMPRGVNLLGSGCCSEVKANYSINHQQYMWK